MPVPINPRRSMEVLAKHEQRLQDDFLIPALLALQADFWAQENAKEELARSWKNHRLRGGLGFYYPHPDPTFAGQKASLTVVLRQSARYQLSDGRFANLPLLSEDPDAWVRIGSNQSSVNHENPAEVDWFVEKAKRFLTAFEPQFACGDTDVNIARSFGDDPTMVAWPLAYYGPYEVARLGTETLLKAPAWKVEKDERGGIWLQAAQNPFTVERKDLRALANHLELNPPKG